jgi:hypothetical protein
MRLDSGLAIDREGNFALRTNTPGLDQQWQCASSAAAALSWTLRVSCSTPAQMAAAIELQGHVFALDGVHAALMADTPASLAHTDPAALRDQFREQGYLLVRELLPRPLVAAVEVEIRALVAAGPQEGLGRGMLPRQHADTIMNSATFRRVSHGPELFGLFDALFDEPSVTLDYKHFRAVGPGNGTPFHMDRTYMGRGSRRLTTAWVPWHDIDLRTGGVAVVEGSTSLPGFKRVRETYGEQEIHGMLSSDPHECLSYDTAARWLTADYRAGDVLVFPMDLLHGSCTNRNHAGAPLRLSSDIRFQPLAGAKPSCRFSNSHETRSFLTFAQIGSDQTQRSI